MNIWIGEDGKPNYSRTTVAPAASKDHFAEYSASLETHLGTAHTTDLVTSVPKTVALKEMAQRAARAGAVLATAKLEQRAKADEAQMRELGEYDEEGEEEEARPAAKASVIDLIIAAKASVRSRQEKRSKR